MSSANQARIAAIVMFLAIGLGAMGAHALEAILAESNRLDEWKTAALYQLVHGVAMLAVAIPSKNRTPFCFWAWLIGVILFSGSLYVLCLSGITKLGMITPLGGLAMMIGWLALIIKPNTILPR